ncbi:MAG: hypothetical protein HS114_31960 [Anaerolineales bacterium]|nr:hypothetical protein [Anaerolineales bacterium]
MASQRKPSSPLFQSISKPFERSPAWVRVLSWCILGAISAVLVATLISCPILLLVWLLSAGNFQAGLSQSHANSGDSTFTPALTSSPAPVGSPGSSTASSPEAGSASEGTAAHSTLPAESQTQGTPSSLSPTGSPGSNGTASNSAAANSATPGEPDSSGSAESGSESSSSPITRPASATPGAAAADGTPSPLTSATPDSAGLTATARLSASSSTPTPIPPSPTATPTPPTVPAATPTPRGPTPPPRRTPAPYTVVPLSNPAPPPTPVPLPTNTPRPTSTPTPATPIPVSTRIVAPAAAPNLPSGILTLLDPISTEIPPSRGPTTFIWEWTGDPLPPEYGFEVRVWLTGEPQAGVHDAVLDHREGRIESLSSDRYQLKVGNIRYAQGVLGREGIYNWTVAVVRVSPAYADFGLQTVPARFLYEPFQIGR